MQIDEFVAKSSQIRTDFLRTGVELCFTFAKVAETTDDDEAASRAIEQAEKAYSTLDHFLSDPKHAKHITDEEHLELKAALERVREQLDRLEL